MRKLSRRAIDRTVHQLLASHRIVAPPVDVERIARELKIPIRFEILPEPISGFLHRDGSLNAIVVNKRHSRQRQRFTIAHEIGHFVLGHNTENIHVEKEYPINLPAQNVKFRRKSEHEGYADKEEVYANAFAASLLMPEYMIRVDMEKAIADRSFDDTLINALAKRYNVSEHALVIQLNTLDLAPSFL